MSKPTLNAAEMRRSNRNRVLEHIRAGGCSRIELARRTGLTRAAIGVIVDDLLSQGVLLECEAQSGGVGRRAIGLALNPNAFYVIGLNLSREGFTLGLVDFSGKTLCQMHRPAATDLSSGKVLALIEQDLAKLLAQPPPGRLLGMGVTAPGPLDTRAGQLLNPPNFGRWHNFTIVDYFKERLGCPVLLENNSSALALAEKAYGAGRNYDSFFSLVVDTGIGGGFIYKGELYKGSTGFGAELGHSSIVFNGPRCSCGNLGCAELYAAIPNIVAAARQGDPTLQSWQDIVDAALAGNPVARQTMEQEAEYLSCILVTAVQMLDVPAIILFGDVTYQFKHIAENIRNKINSRILSRQLNQVELVASQLPNPPITLASANLVIESYFKTGELICLG